MRVLTVMVAAAALAAAGPSGAAEPASRPAVRGASNIGAADGAVVRVGSPGEAVALALRRSPTLGAAAAGVQATRGDLLQAGLRPNPEAAVTGENVAGSGQYRAARQLEATFELRQRLEVGGKRAARVGVARRDVALAGRDLAATWLDLVRDVRLAFVEAVAARRAAAIEADRLRLAEDFLRATRERVSAGREPPAQELRAGVARSAAAIARQRAEREAVLARRALAVLLFAREVEIARGDRWFDDIGRAAPPPPPGAEAAVAAPRLLEANPDFARWDDALARAEAVLTLERRQAIPDVTVGAGVRRYRETSDTAFVLGVSVPLPVFNRNQGAIARASAEVARTQLAAAQARHALGAALADATRRLEVAWREADALRRTVVPAAGQAYAYAREGYVEGKFSFLEVLDAQRTLFDARQQLNEALRDVHARRAELDRLLGGPAAAPPPLADGGQRR